MNMVILKYFILLNYLIKKSSQTSDFKNDHDYFSVYLTSFESSSRKGEYDTYEARLSVAVQYTPKQNSPGDNLFGVITTTKQRRPPSEKCSKMGTEIVNLLNDYRKGLNLSILALDDDLCFVAKMHVLANKARHRGGGGQITHDWDPPPASSTPSIKWDQMRFDPEIPRKLIGYSGYIAGENAAVAARTAKQVIRMWKGSPGHNDLMVNSGSWKDMKPQGAGADCDVSETYLCYLWIGNGKVKKATDTTLDGSGSGNSPVGSSYKGSAQKGYGSRNKGLERSGSGNLPEGSNPERSTQEGTGHRNEGLEESGSGNSPEGSNPKRSAKKGSGYGNKGFEGSGSGKPPEGSSYKGSAQDGSGSRNKGLEGLEGSGSGNLPEGSNPEGSTQEGTGHRNEGLEGSGSGNPPEGSNPEESGYGNKRFKESGSGKSPEGSSLEGSNHEGCGSGNEGFLHKSITLNGFPLSVIPLASPEFLPEGFPSEGFPHQGFLPDGHAFKKSGTEGKIHELIP